MKGITKEAAAEVEELYNSLGPVASNIACQYSAGVDVIIDKINKMPTITNDELRQYILVLSIESYKFAPAKDVSTLKSACSKALMQEKQAISYNSTEGTVAARQNATTINTSDSIVVNMLYTAVCDLLKTKLDETHRVINSLNNILISRQADAKIEASNGGGQVRLNEG